MVVNENRVELVAVALQRVFLLPVDFHVNDLGDALFQKAVEFSPTLLDRSELVLNALSQPEVDDRIEREYAKDQGADGRRDEAEENKGDEEVDEYAVALEHHGVFDTDRMLFAFAHVLGAQQRALLLVFAN